MTNDELKTLTSEVWRLCDALHEGRVTLAQCVERLSALDAQGAEETNVTYALTTLLNVIATRK